MRNCDTRQAYLTKINTYCMQYMLSGGFLPLLSQLPAFLTRFLHPTGCLLTAYWSLRGYQN